MPRLWEKWESRPTHQPKPTRTRNYRTRLDPFDGDWTTILEWLQKEPDVAASSLLERVVLNSFFGRQIDGTRGREWSIHKHSNMPSISKPNAKPSVIPLLCEGTIKASSDVKTTNPINHEMHEAHER